MPWLSRKQERKKERQAEFEAQCEEQRLEFARKDALSMWERIEESDASEDVKDILRRLADHSGGN